MVRRNYLIRSLPLAVLTLLRSDPINHDFGHRGNDLAFICVIGGEGDEHELRSIRQLDVSGVVPRRAGPTGLRPKFHAGHSLQSDAGKAMSLIVIVLRSA